MYALEMIDIDKIYNEDCLEGMKRIPDGFIDCIICDLPYGVTACKWDSQIPLKPLWEQYERIIRPDGAIVLFSTQPFTTTLISSRIELYRYSWVWMKEKGSNFQLANVQPLRKTEDICVFGKAKAANGAKPPLRFFPILEHRETPLKYGGGKHIGGEHLNKNPMKKIDKTYTTRNPTNVLNFSKDYGQNNFHPTQKPVELLQYLIKTYTLEGETVLDNCMGGGSTAVACIKEKRHFIGFELDRKYYDIANKRIEKELTVEKL